MAFSELSIFDLTFPEGRLPEIALVDWGSAGKDYLIQVFTKHGMEQHSYTTSSNLSASYRAFRLSEIPMKVVATTGVAYVRRGEVYVRASLRLGGVRNFPLFCGYVTDNCQLAWPPGFFEHSVEGPGLLRSVTGTDPAAGAEISETVPTNARWRILSMYFSLVTGTTVTTRNVTVAIDDGTNIYGRFDPNSAHTASTTLAYSLGPGKGISGGRAVMVEIGASTPLLLFQGHRIRTVTSNLQAGDNYGAPQLLVEEWIEE